MKLSTFKKILPALRAINTPAGKHPNDRTIDVGQLSEARDGGAADYLVIKAADMITQLEIKALGVDTSNFDACINFGKFNKLLGSIKSMPSFDYETGVPDALKLSIGKRTIKLDSAKLQRMDYGTREYSSNGDDGMQWDVSRLIEGLEFTSPAMSNDETRFHLCGTLLAPNGDLVTTDGHRLHVYNYYQQELQTTKFFGSAGKIGETEKHQDTILSSQHVKMLQCAIKACGGFKASVYSTRGTQAGVAFLQFIVDGGGLSFKLTCKLIDSQFPPYHAVIPKNNDTRAIVNCSEFVAAAKLITKMLDSDTRGVEFALNGQLHLRGGGVSESLEAPYTGEGFEWGHIGANGKYLADAADLPNECCSIEFGKALEAIKITQDGGFLAVVMPMRI